MRWDRPHLYRGTTLGWPGSEGLREAGFTPTFTDPLVATLFAVLCRNHGPSELLIAERAPLDRFAGVPNYLGELECAVNLEMTPLDFFQYVVCRVEVDRALLILAGMGFDRMPVRLRPPATLMEELEDTRKRAYRLSLEQTFEFNRRAFEAEP